MINSMKKDILTPEDIKAIVDGFYDKVRENPIIGHYFKGVDWEHHLPVMYKFWSFLILGEGEYRGNPLSKHLKLEGLQETHFNEWLRLFEATINEHFSGETAAAMKNRALQIAWV